MANDDLIRDALQATWDRRRNRDSEKSHGYVIILVAAAILYAFMEVLTHYKQFSQFADIEANPHGRPYDIALKPPDWSALGGWTEPAIIDPANATVMVTAALLFVATFNVAAIASALERSPRGLPGPLAQLPGQLTQLWWRRIAGDISRIASAVALAVSATQFPASPGIGIALLFLAALTAAGSGLATSDTTAQISKLVGLASLLNTKHNATEAISLSFNPSTHKRLIARLPRGSLVRKRLVLVLLLMSLLVGAIFLEATAQTLWWCIKDLFNGVHPIRPWGVFAATIATDSYVTGTPLLILTLGIFVFWYGRAWRKWFANAFLTVILAFIAYMVFASWIGLSDGSPALYIPVSIVGTLIVVTLFFVVAKVTGRGIGAPLSVILLLHLRTDIAAAKAEYDKAWARDYDALRHELTQHAPPVMDPDEPKPSQKIATWRAALRQLAGRIPK